MSLILTTTLSNTISKSELEANFSSIQTKFSGGIDNSDIRGNAGISIDKLDASKEYVIVMLKSQADGTGLDTADQYRDFVAVPGLSADQANWTLKGASWLCVDVGTGAASFDIEWCNYDDDGEIQTQSTVISDEDITKASVGAANNTANAGQCTVDSAALPFDGAAARFFALKVNTADAGALEPAGTSAAPSFLTVSLLLERAIQA